MSVIAAKAYKYTLPAGGAEMHVSANECRYVRCTESDGAFEIAIDQGDTWQPFMVGQQISVAQEAEPFTVLRLRNMGQQPVNVELRVGSGGFDDNRLQYTGNVASVEVLPSTFDAGQVAIADSTEGEVLAIANPSRRALTIKNAAATGGATLYIGGSPTTNAFNGWPIAPQESVTIANTAAIYGYQTSGAAMMIPIVEEA